MSNRWPDCLESPTAQQMRDRSMPFPEICRSCGYDQKAHDYVQHALGACAEFTPAPPAQMVAGEPTHRHKKRGSTYTLIGIGKMQAENWGKRHDGIGYSSVDMREVAIYRSTDDGSLWVRPREEFEDGRFECLASAEVEG